MTFCHVRSEAKSFAALFLSALTEPGPGTRSFGIRPAGASDHVPHNNKFALLVRR
jgi:hypothetical protein